MNLVRIVAGIAAVVLVSVLWVNVLRTVVIPRHDSPRLPRWTLRLSAAVLGKFACRLPVRARMPVLAFIAPVSLFLVFGVWLAGLVVAFALAAWGLAGTGPDPAAFVELAALRGGGAQVIVALLLWLCTVFLVGLFLMMLVRIVEAYGRRELLVARIAAQASEPPDAERMIAAYVRTGSQDSLGALFAEWTAWLADIGCTHTGYPALMYYRPANGLSWLRAAATVLDTAALVEAMAPSWAPPNTHVLIGTGSRCLERLGSDLGIELPRSEVSLHWREQRGFADTIRIARTAGLAVERTPQEAWHAFQDMRTRYAPYAATIGSILHYEVTDGSYDTPSLLSGE